MEPEREVHKPWEELFDGSPCQKPSVKSSYDGYDSGGKVGPSNAITQTLRTQKTLCSAFFFIFQTSLFTHIAKQTHRYAYEEWVRPVDAGHDRDGNKRKRAIYKSCKKTDDGAQHRASSERFQYKVTQNYVIAWIGYLIYVSAVFGGKVACSELIYQETPYGVSISF